MGGKGGSGTSSASSTERAARRPQGTPVADVVTGVIPAGHVAVVAVDPGGTTGLVILSVPANTIYGDPAKRKPYAGFNIALYDQLHGSEDAQAEAVLDAAKWADDLCEYRVAIVMESFVLRKFSKDAALLSPVRILEQIKARFDKYIPKSVRDRFNLVQIFFQQPSTAMTVVTDARLIRWGYWIGPISSWRHARDALRHGITFIRRCAGDPALRDLAFGPMPKDKIEAAIRKAGKASGPAGRKAK